MTCSQTAIQHSNISERQVVQSLVELAKTKYVLSDNFCLTNNLSYFLFNVIEDISITNDYPLSSIEIMENLFREEIAFAKEAVHRIEKNLHRKLKETDYLVLTELIIAASYQLNVNAHEQERYLQLIHYLLTKISLYIQLSQSHIFSKTPSLIRHIKFLALRILKEKQDVSDSDNDLYLYISNHYSSEFIVANQIRVFITENFDFDLSNDEISYLTMHFLVLKDKIKRDA